MNYVDIVIILYRQTGRQEEKQTHHSGSKFQGFWNFSKKFFEVC